MSFDSHFFVCKPEDLPQGFPGWLAALPHPVPRTSWNPITRELLSIDSRAPSDDELSAADPGPWLAVLAAASPTGRHGYEEDTAELFEKLHGGPDDDDEYDGDDHPDDDDDSEDQGRRELDDADIRTPEEHEKAHEKDMDEASEFAAQGIIPFVRDRPHFCCLQITDMELEPLAEALGVEATFEWPLYAPGKVTHVLVQLPDAMVSKLASIAERALDEIVGVVAEARRVHPLSLRYIVRHIAALARKARPQEKMYLLILA
jgi:hypothetical protein